MKMPMLPTALPLQPVPITVKLALPIAGTDDTASQFVPASWPAQTLTVGVCVDNEAATLPSEPRPSVAADPDTTGAPDTSETGPDPDTTGPADTSETGPDPDTTGPADTSTSEPSDTSTSTCGAADDDTAPKTAGSSNRGVTAALAAAAPGTASSEAATSTASDAADTLSTLSR